jgi:3-methyladenine DNA glycosylase/8-oxoguanine DNA glycosylase
MIIIGVLVRQVGARGLHVMDLVPLEDLWIIEAMHAQ